MNCIVDVIVEDLLVQGAPEEVVTTDVQELVGVVAAMGEEGLGKD